MIINYFDKYKIDTEGLKCKLKIIEESKTENALYITNVLPKAIKYIFKEKIYNGTELLKIDFEKQHLMADALICFDSQKEDVELEKFYSKLTDKYICIVVGNMKTHIINKNLRYINIKEIIRKKNILQDIKAFIVFNLECIDFSKYYYTRIRNYFLNVINKFLKLDENRLREDTEKICEDILLDEKNFISEFESTKETLKLKDIISAYAMLLKQNIVLPNWDKNDAFYIGDENIDKDMKDAILIELSKLLCVCNKKNLEDKFSFIYDDMCSKMLDEALNLNYCDFINDRCVTARYTKGFPNSKVNGCCANTYMDKHKNCRYLKEDHSCSICSIACRTFTCVYLQKRGIDHTLWQYPIIDCTVKKLYRSSIIFEFFTPKEKMFKKLKKSITV